MGMIEPGFNRSYPTDSTWKHHLLTPADMGKRFVRAYSHSNDWSVVPYNKSAETIDRVALHFLGFRRQDPNDVLLFDDPAFERTRTFTNDWNDGYWVEVDVFKSHFKII